MKWRLRPTPVCRREWKAESNPLRDFLEECCEIEPGNQDRWCTVSLLWDAYTEWTNENGERSVSREEFNQQLEKNHVCKRVSSRVKGKPTKIWRGITVTKENNKSYPVVGLRPPTLKALTQ